MTERKQFDYIAEAHLTASPHFFGHLVPHSYFADVLKEAIEALQKLDGIKKTLFYGRELGVKNIGGAQADCEHLPAWLSDTKNDTQDAIAVNLIHGILGKATENGELLEALFSAVIEGRSFDRVNAGEEVGDGQWYDALILKAIGMTFDEVQRVNIQKLRKRFPNKFTEFDANNRDIPAEREILEQREKRTADELTKILLDTTDASVWAEEFMAVVRSFPDIAQLDKSFMIGWFANAIEVAKMHEQSSLRKNFLMN